MTSTTPKQGSSPGRRRLRSRPALRQGEPRVRRVGQGRAGGARRGARSTEEAEHMQQAEEDGKSHSKGEGPLVNSRQAARAESALRDRRRRRSRRPALDGAGSARAGGTCADFGLRTGGGMPPLVRASAAHSPSFFASSRDARIDEGHDRRERAAAAPAAPPRAALPTSLPTSSDTAGSPSVPRTRTGVRSVSGLKSFGETTARRSRLSSRTTPCRRSRSSSRVVLTTNTFGRATPLDDVEVDDVALDRQRLVALEHACRAPGRRRGPPPRRRGARWRRRACACAGRRRGCRGSRRSSGRVPFTFTSASSLPER